MRTRFVRFQGMGNQVPSSSWWLVMAPGLMLISFGVAILVWPELLAYLVAFIVLSLGITVTGWGWRLRQLERRQKRSFSAEQGTTPQQDSHNPRVVLNPGNTEQRASDTTIYYERR